jgi:acyl-CoA thioesterase I
MSYSANLMLPSLGLSRPANKPSSVDLPEPEDPIMATDSPALISRSIPFNMHSGPSEVVTVFSIALAFIMVTGLLVSGRFKHCLSSLLTLLLTGSLLFSAHTLAASKNILVLGDSLSAAYGIPQQSGWVQLLADDLDKQQAPYKVINASISGETTGGGLARLPTLLATHQPAIVIIELGANDGLRGFPIKTLRGNLSELVTLSQAANAKVLLVGIHIPPNYGSRYTRLFHDSYSLLSEQHQTALAPFLLEGIATETTLMQADGLHPIADAQARILQNVMPYLKELL